MKKILGAILLLSMVGIVSAGSIENLDHNDRFMFWYKVPVQINDNDVQIDADTLQGHTSAEFLKDEVGEADGRGVRWRTVEYALTGVKDGLEGYDNYLQLLDIRYDAVITRLEARVRVLEAKLDVRPTEKEIETTYGLLMAQKYGTYTTDSGYECKDNTCIRLR